MTTRLHKTTINTPDMAQTVQNEHKDTQNDYTELPNI